jgi:hypothetical protein
MKFVHAPQARSLSCFETDFLSYVIFCRQELAILQTSAVHWRHFSRRWVHMVALAALAERRYLLSQLIELTLARLVVKGYVLRGAITEAVISRLKQSPFPQIMHTSLGTVSKRNGTVEMPEDTQSHIQEIMLLTRANLHPRSLNHQIQVFEHGPTIIQEQ